MEMCRQANEREIIERKWKEAAGQSGKMARATRKKDGLRHKVKRKKRWLAPF